MNEQQTEEPGPPGSHQARHEEVAGGMNQAPIQRINFHTHQMSMGIMGAAEDFEQMIALLVRKTFGDGRMIFANPGDWGIDVFVGSLTDHVSVWQAKYFIRGVGKHQTIQIREAFSAAAKCAAEHGYVLDRWFLCVPSSMDAPSMQWWQNWREQRQAELGATIELWDETELRVRLLAPEASQIYNHYYVNDTDAASAEVKQCLFDVWSAIDGLVGRPKGQVYVDRLARLSGVDPLAVELSRKTRNDLAHRGHGGVPAGTAIQALSTARLVLIRVAERMTPLPSEM